MKKVVELGAKGVRRRTNIQHVVLHTIAATGVLSMALLAPNALQILQMFDGGKTRRQHPKYLFATAFEKLLAKGLVTVERTGKGKYIRLTDSGKYKLAEMVAHNPDTRKHKRWDKRWRMVTYDIKEERKLARMELKGLLRDFGFYKLQNSVWIYPYDCEALVILLKAHFKLGHEVIYAVVEKIENDQRILDYFSLK